MWHVLILTTTSFTGYADDSTSFVVTEKITIVVKALGDIGENLVKWFSDNQTESKYRRISCFF